MLKDSLQLMNRGTIICVDDERRMLHDLRDCLSPIIADYAIELADSGVAALSLIAELAQNQIEVPLIICDRAMPEMDGATLLSHLHGQFPKAQKILITELAGLNEAIQAVDRVNLYRYITKPWDETDLGLTVREALRSYEQAKQLAEQNQTLKQMHLELQREIANRRRAEALLVYDALHDALTGLPNRTLLVERIEQAVRTARYDSAYQFAVLFIDLDRFKIVNDSLGHTVGDELLVAISTRFRNCLRNTDIVARLGGDEFTVLLEGIQDPSDATQVAQRILESLCTPFNLKSHTLAASASIGIVMGSTAYENAADLLRDADLAMYHAKETGRSCYALFNRELHVQTLKVLQIQSDLRQALEREEFVLHYQPIVSLSTGKLIGFEALVRWQHPQQGFISPADFIPTAEETGFIIFLGEWVLREACRQMRQWQQQFPLHSPLTISVNISGKQFSQANFVQQIEQILLETGFDAHLLKLEITESVLMENANSTTMLSQLQALGIRLSIDDFGTGYSSLSYLHRLRLDTLKIDRSFVRDVDLNVEKIEIIRTIIALAWNLGMDVVAEGIETKKQLFQLRSLKCEYGQGYLFSKPLDCEKIETLLAQDLPLHY
jgi:diguanylate cyclase (GGDEF)-like protein